MNRRNMLNKVREIIEMARKKKYILLSYFIQKWCLISIYKYYFYFSRLFMDVESWMLVAVVSYYFPWLLNEQNIIIISITKNWMHAHFFFFFFELELYDASEAFHNGFYTIRSWMRALSIEHSPFTVTMDLKDKRQQWRGTSNK